MNDAIQMIDIQLLEQSSHLKGKRPCFLSASSSLGAFISCLLGSRRTRRSRSQRYGIRSFTRKRWRRVLRFQRLNSFHGSHRTSRSSSRRLGCQLIGLLLGGIWWDRRRWRRGLELDGGLGGRFRVRCCGTTLDSSKVDTAIRTLSLIKLELDGRQRGRINESPLGMQHATRYHGVLAFHWIRPVYIYV